MSCITKNARMDTCYLFLQGAASCHAAIVTPGCLHQSLRLSHPNTTIHFGTGTNRMFKVSAYLPTASQEPAWIPLKMRRSRQVFSQPHEEPGAKLWSENNKVVGGLDFPVFVLYFPSVKKKKKKEGTNALVTVLKKVPLRPYLKSAASVTTFTWFIAGEWFCHITHLK